MSETETETQADEPTADVKLNLALAGIGSNGEVVTLPEAQAAQLVELGHAEPVEDAESDDAPDVDLGDEPTGEDVIAATNKALQAQQSPKNDPKNPADKPVPEDDAPTDAPKPAHRPARKSTASKA